MVDILIFGATGFCGRHAARYILEHSDRPKYTVGLAARSQSKLLSIGLPIDDTVQLFEVDILDEQAVEGAVRQAKVVLNCAGPFWHYGTPVVRYVTQICSDCIMIYSHTDVGTDPHLYMHQCVRTEWRTLRRYNWRDTLDSRHNQKVRHYFFF